MGKVFSQIKIALILVGAASLYMNFSNPKLANHTMKVVTDPLKVKPAANKGFAQPNEALPTGEPVKRFVKIDGKLYEYNPRNVYNVNGVQMMYKNGNPMTIEQLQGNDRAVAERLQAKAEQDGAEGESQPGHARAGQGAPVGEGSALKQVHQMLQNNPSAIYTPGGARALIDGAREAAAHAEKHNRELNYFYNQ